MSESQKALLYLALGFVLFYLWANWVRVPSNKAVQKPSSVPQVSASVNSSVPNVALISQSDNLRKRTTLITNKAPKDRLVSIQTNKLQVKIDQLGGRIVEVGLSNYPVSLTQKHIPSKLLTDNPNRLFVAETGLIEKNAKTHANDKILYHSSQLDYNFKGSHQPEVVYLGWERWNKVLIRKSFTFYPDRYIIKVGYEVKNPTQSTWVGHFYAQLREKKPQKRSFGLLTFNTFKGASVFTPDHPYTKLSYKKMDNYPFNQRIKGGWIAIQKRYFIGAWVPDRYTYHHYFSQAASSDNIYTVGYLSEPFEVKAGKTYQTQTTLYAGPEKVNLLSRLAKGLDLTVDYGWLWPFSMAIMWAMRNIHSVIGNWGWSIVLVTLLIKLLFFKLSGVSYRSMAKMRKLQPKMELIKTRYADDKQAMSQAMMELYKKEKVNPMGGCLPVIVQIPVFIALYYVLVESVELRQAPFIFWIHDLSAKDPYFILPVLMGLSMLAQQAMTPTSPDPVQQKMMYIMPIMFTVLFINFPSGLVLYWLVNNVTSILQQWYATRLYSNA